MEKEDDSRKWKTLKSDIIVSRPPWLRVRHDEVQLPDGRVNPELYVLEYPDWVNVIAITDDGHMVMEMQYRYGLGETCVEICAGVIEEGRLLSRPHGVSLRRRPATPEASGRNG